MLIPLSRWTEFALGSGPRVLGIVLLALLLNRMLKAVTHRLVKLTSSQMRVAQMREQQTRTVAGILYSAGTSMILILAVLAALPEFGFSVTPIAALAGLASLALGFGAQNVVRDILSGFFIVFEDQYVVGDTIRVGETNGRVEHITLRRTVLRDDTGSLITIANGEIRQVANLSRDWSQLFVDVQVAGECPVDTALAALERVANEMRNDPAWAPALVDGPRVLGVEALAPGGAKLRVQARTVPGRQFDAGRELRRRIQKRFDEKQIRSTSVQQVELVPSARSPESEMAGQLTQK